MIRVYPVRPIPAPRQTRRDAFKPRPCVLRYRAYRDELRIYHMQIPQPFYHVIFVLRMPSRWPQQQRASMHGKPHQQKPDKDNLEKALLDSVFENDCHIWDGRVTKVWGHTDCVVVASFNQDSISSEDVQRWERMAAQPFTQVQNVAHHATRDVGSSHGQADPLPQTTERACARTEAAAGAARHGT